MLLFTLSGQSFRHRFIVVEGGDLLLLGNDFIALYHATVTPLQKDGTGNMQLTVTVDGQERVVDVALSCQPPTTEPRQVTAAVTPAEPAATKNEPPKRSAKAESDV